MCGEMFRTRDDSLDEAHIVPKHADEFVGEDARCLDQEAIHCANHERRLDNSRSVNADLCFLGTGPK